MSSSAPLRLSLGSGPLVIAGWLSIDKSWTPLLMRRPGLHLGILDAGQASMPWPRDIQRMDLARACHGRTGAPTRSIVAFPRALSTRSHRPCLIVAAAPYVRRLRKVGFVGVVRRAYRRAHVVYLHLDAIYLIPRTQFHPDT